MSAYIILDIEVTDLAGYANYKELAQATLIKYGGKYLARGGKAENLEGHWLPKRIVILEFPTMNLAKSWLNSPEYAPARGLRHKFAKSEAVLVCKGPSKMVE